MPIYNSNNQLISTVNAPITRQEVGSTGRAISSRFQTLLSTDEYLSSLTFPNNISVYNKMERSDGQVKAILLMLSLPIRSTQWFVRPYDNSKKSKKIAEFIEKSLFGGYGEGLNNGFDSFIRDITTMFTFGFSMFEKVFEVNKDGFLKWKKFAVRPQSTIDTIYYDKVGDFSSVDQYIISNGWKNVNIPVEKLLVFSHDMQQGDIKGTSVLRSAYKHWFIKDFLYKIVNIGVERNLVGTPVLTLPENYTQQDKDLADEIVTTLRSHEYGGVRLPHGFDLSMFEGKRSLIDVFPYIEYQDLLITKCIVAQFMNLGSGSSGSFALSSDQSKLFLMMLDSAGKNIANVINTHAIPELVKYNFASDLYPTLGFKPMDNSKLINTLKTLIDGKMILPDDDLEDYLRDMLDLPDKNPIKTRKEMSEQNQQVATNNNNKIEINSKSKNPIENNSKQKQYTDKIKNNKIEDKNIKNTNPAMNKLNEDKEAIILKQIEHLQLKAKDCKDMNDLIRLKVSCKKDMTNIIEQMYQLEHNKITLSEYEKMVCSLKANEVSEVVKAETILSHFSKKYDKKVILNEISEKISN